MELRIETDILRRCWFLAGPTACGKTAVGLLLAERLGAEIIAMDSMSIYRRMDVGTAKPTPEEQQRVPHHLIDLVSPHEEFSVAEYVAAAEEACRRIIERQRVPLFVGGTGLYLRSILRGVFEGPPADWDLRRRLEDEEATQRGVLHQRLSEIDPASARRLHPNDRRRIIRALEIFEATGHPASELQQEGPLPVKDRPHNVFWLSPPREWLYHRIDERVEQMVTDGLVEEVALLLKLPRPLSRTAQQALGYREIIDHLSGDCTLGEAITRMQTSTRQFAKRQHTWFRNLEECRAIKITGEETTAEIVDLLIRIAES